MINEEDQARYLRRGDSRTSVPDTGSAQKKLYGRASTQYWSGLVTIGRQNSILEAMEMWEFGSVIQSSI